VRLLDYETRIANVVQDIEEYRIDWWHSRLDC